MTNLSTLEDKSGEESGISNEEIELDEDGHIGWLKDEYQIFNIPMESRGKRADEYIQLLKKIWTDDVVNSKEIL